jgi:3-isopropylmalate dehydrogenase
VNYDLLLLAGDGIGPEVVAQARRVLEAVDTRYELGFKFSEANIGGIAIDKEGAPYPPSTQKLAREGRRYFAWRGGRSGVGWFTRCRPA